MSLKRSYLKRGKPLKKQGERSLRWQDFRNLKALKDRDVEGLIECQDYRVGLPKCGQRVPSPDLHHTEGRDGDLLTDESKMVWLVRACHEAIHNQR